MEYQFARRDAINATQQATCKLKFVNGHTCVQPLGNFKEHCSDECTGERLPDDLFRAATANELQYFGDTVLELATPEEVKQDVCAVVVGGRWVLCNKGDTTAPKICAQFVATEANHAHDVAFYAATPPLEAKRLIFNDFAHTHHE